MIFGLIDGFPYDWYYAGCICPACLQSRQFASMQFASMQFSSAQQQAMYAQNSQQNFFYNAQQAQWCDAPPRRPEPWETGWWDSPIDWEKIP